MEAKLANKYKIAIISSDELVLGFKIAGRRDAFIVEGGAEAEHVIRDVRRGRTSASSW